MAARQRLLQERARRVAQLVELAAGALCVVAGPKRTHRGRQVRDRRASSGRGEDLPFCDTQVLAVAIAGHRPAPRCERLGEGARVLRRRDPGPVAAAVVTPAIEKPQRSVAQLFEDIEPAGISEGAAHRSEIFEALCVVRSGCTFDPDAAERPLQNVGALTV